MKKSYLIIYVLVVLLYSCSKNSTDAAPLTEDTFVRAADVSYLPLIESEGIIYKHNGQSENALITLKNAGCNTIRIRLWKNPIDGHSGLAEVKALSLRAKNLGMKVWLTVHYSDTWADPANQNKPAEWASLSFTNLKNAVSSYTATIMNEIDPDIIQIGNETNDGMLWPDGRISSNEEHYLELVQSAVSSIRSISPSTKIMLHYAGVDSGSTLFFSKVTAIDYDYIGLSYYPIWHGNNLSNVTNAINLVGQTYNKKVLIAETAYPFTLSWNDWTNNIVGLDNQLIPAFPASNSGQKSFVLAIKNALKQSNYGQGFCYWGGEWLAFRGTQSTNGSSWENQALWDFNNNSLPVMDAFNQN